MDNLDSISAAMTTWATLYGVKIVVALLMFIIGRWVVKKMGNFTERVMLSREVDEALVNFGSSMVYYALLIFVVIAALGQVGIQTASFVAIGLAMQGSLSSFAAGILIIIFKPLKLATSSKWRAPLG